MGIHVVGELVAKADFSKGEGGFRVRAVPEESTNDLGIPLTVETGKGELQLWVHEQWVDLPVGEGLVLRLKAAGNGQSVELSFALPYREWLNEKEVIKLNLGPLRDLAQKKLGRGEFLTALQAAAATLASVLEDAEEIFRPGPLGPKGFKYFEEDEKAT